MDDEDKKDDVALTDTAIDDVLEETEDDELAIADPLAGIDEFGGGEVEKQWE
jgi:hypothetical protein